jgi:hypothetical protein
MIGHNFPLSSSLSLLVEKHGLPTVLDTLRYLYLGQPDLQIDDAFLGALENATQLATRLDLPN